MSIDNLSCLHPSIYVGCHNYTISCAHACLEGVHTIFVRGKPEELTPSQIHSLRIVFM